MHRGEYTDLAVLGGRLEAVQIIDVHALVSGLAEAGKKH